MLLYEGTGTLGCNVDVLLSLVPEIGFKQFNYFPFIFLQTDGIFFLVAFSLTKSKNGKF